MSQGKVVVCLVLMLFFAGEAKEIHRIAVAAGANFGGSERPSLRYATTDATSFLKVVNQMGGVVPENNILLKEPTVQEFNAMFDELNIRIKALSKQDVKTEVILYYSGHANEKGLLLGKELYGYSDFRKRINALQSDVKIVVLDACASGSITRFKGGLRKQAFLVDESRDMKGYAFITSSSGDEVSQESDKISGSFFTHYLLSGLRGAADISGDGKVTLSEAYQFAFNETLSNTEKTDGGAQHANYDMKLSGTGDVIFTDIRKISSGLLLGEGVSGRIFIRNHNDHLIAELYKQEGRAIELGLEPGEYSVRLEQKNVYKTSSVSIAQGKRMVLNDRNFIVQEREATVTRGDTIRLYPDSAVHAVVIHPTTNEAKRPEFSDEKKSSFEPFYNEKMSPFNGSMFSLGINSSNSISGSQISGVANINRGYSGGFQISGFVNIADDIDYVQLAGLYNSANNMKGFQISGLINSVDTIEGVQIGEWNSADSVYGGQYSGLVNYTGALEGFQVGGLVNISGNTKGFQLGGLLNISDNTQGFQASGLVNIADRVGGVQAAGLMNISDDIQGVQASGIGNVADNVEGLQATAIFNSADTVLGSQISTILNSGDNVSGIQLGLVNISDSCDYTIGLINYSTHGMRAITLWVDETGMDNISLYTGGKKIYGIITFGRKMVSSTQPVQFGLGIGYQADLNKHWYMNVDLNRYAVKRINDSWDEKNIQSLQRFRVSLGTRVSSWFSLYGGVSHALLVAHEEKDPYVLPMGDNRYRFSAWDYRVYQWPGYFAGVRFDI